MSQKRVRNENANYILLRAVARSEIMDGLVVLGGDNVSPLVEIGLADLPNIGVAKAPPQPPPCDGPAVLKWMKVNQKICDRFS